jgi:hypothetical protein
MGESDLINSVDDDLVGHSRIEPFLRSRVPRPRSLLPFEAC